MGKRREKNTNSCEGYLSNNDDLITSDTLRQLLGFATKYVLQKKYWDFQGNLVIRPFKGITFDMRPEVRSTVDAFLSRDAAQMSQDDALNDCLKWLVGYAKGLANRRCDVKTRKRRLTMVARDFKKRLRQKNTYDQKAGQGVVIFVHSIKAQFLGKKRYVNGG